MRLAIVLALLPLSANAQSCTDFWYFKERALQIAGKCPSSPQAEAMFGTNGCSANPPRHAAAENYLAHVNGVLDGPCRGQVNIAELSPQRRAALSMVALLPMMEEAGMGLWCKGWRGATMSLRHSPSDAAPIVGQIKAGQEFSSVARMTGDWIYLASDTVQGWTLHPDNISQCDEFAG